MPAPSVRPSRESHDAFDPRPPHHHLGLPGLPAVADLLARQHELQDQQRDRHHHDAVAASADHRQLHAHLHRRELVFRLHQLAEIRADQHRDLDLGGAAGGLRASRATASSATSICSSGCCRTAWRRRRSMRCRSSTSIRRSACSIRPGRWRWRIASSTCRWRSGSSKVSSPACRARSTRPRSSTAIRSRASSSRSWCR